MWAVWGSNNRMLFKNPLRPVTAITARMPFAWSVLTGAPLHVPSLTHLVRQDPSYPRWAGLKVFSIWPVQHGGYGALAGAYDPTAGSGGGP